MPPREWTFLNRSPCHDIKKVASLLHFILKWQGMRESNSQQWFWRPLLYHLTNPLYLTNTLNLLHIHLSNERIWRVDLDQVSPFSSNRNGIITSSSISCKFSVLVFGDGVKIKIDLSSPFLGLERESPKNSRASPESGRIPIVPSF